MRNSSEEYKQRLIIQRILGINDSSTQNRLLQEPPTMLEEVLRMLIPQ